VFGFAGVVLCGLELASLAGTMDYHVHVFRLGTLAVVDIDSKQSLRHFHSPLDNHAFFVEHNESFFFGVFNSNSLASNHISVFIHNVEEGDGFKVLILGLGHNGKHGFVVGHFHSPFIVSLRLFYQNQ
jgi:hypothetical protein